MTREEAATREAAMEAAEALPQLDASSLVETAELEAQVKDMYRHVAEEAMPSCTSRPAGASPSTSATRRAAGRDPGGGAGVVRRRRLSPRPGRARAGRGGARPRRGSGTDVFCAARLVGESGRVVGVDITDEQLARRGACATATASRRSSSSRRTSRSCPFEDASFDVVISNGVINLSPVKGRGLRRGGARPAARRAAGARRHRQRRARSRSARGATWSSGPPASPARSRATNYLDAIEAQGLAVSEYGRTTTASSPSGRSTPAAPTRSRASRSSLTRPRSERCRAPSMESNGHRVDAGPDDLTAHPNSHSVASTGTRRGRTEANG